ncbi:2-methylcitrate dehydratase [Pigmentiphaga humi]|uniref:2-methylcitrate dehydratase n=1 Tax=Pigmentiphaga humi TaxID=2478468 RepID=A0A3P4AYE9_9BURK|nr:2-methylcitrate dehydratase [Pigmentiphaga humi]VCU69089.1 2-methylcitrate dehydratase [Pigmentiphaga humi]
MSLTASVAADATGDAVLDLIADFAASRPRWRADTLRTAGLCLADAVGCALAALDDPACARLTGPLFPGAPAGDVGVPGTGRWLDPVKAAFDIGTLVRWLDFSDTTFVSGHPSDNLGAILAAAAHASARRRAAGLAGPTLDDVFDAMVKAYEIQGRLAQANRFDHPSVGLDHVIGVKIASTAVATLLLGGDRDAIRRALSNAWLDGQALNAYRHTPNAGSRKGWAGGDACARALWLAGLALRGDMGYPQPLSAPTWGFQAVHLQERPVRLPRELGSFVLDHVIFKLHPCQRNTTTAVESAIALHAWLDGRQARIERVDIRTQDEAMRRVDKNGALPNRAARDHSMQYIVAVALLKGGLDHGDYADAAAADPRIDRLRARIRLAEDPDYTREHHDPAVRSCANAVRVTLDDGTVSPWVETRFPAGDPSRRDAALPLLASKFRALAAHRWPAERGETLLARLADPAGAAGWPADEFLSSIARV